MVPNTFPVPQFGRVLGFACLVELGQAESERRAMTPEEQKIYDEGVSKARSVADAMKQYRHDQSVFAVARELSDNVTGGLSHDDLGGSSPEAKSRRLSFKGVGAKVATQMLGQVGDKALDASAASDE